MSVLITWFRSEKYSGTRTAIKNSALRKQQTGVDSAQVFSKEYRLNDRRQLLITGVDV
jgi:hypothetical protein